MAKTPVLAAGTLLYDAPSSLGRGAESPLFLHMHFSTNPGLDSNDLAGNPVLEMKVDHGTFDVGLKFDEKDPNKLIGIQVILSGKSEDAVDFIIWANQEHGRNVQNYTSKKGDRTVVLDVPVNATFPKESLAALVAEKKINVSLENSGYKSPYFIQILSTRDVTADYEKFYFKLDLSRTK